MQWLDIAKEFVGMFRQEIIYLSYTILLFGLFQNFIYLLQLPLAMSELINIKLQQRDQHSWWLMTSDIALPISIIIPAYNEQMTIVETVSSTIAIQYPAFEVIVVNDGSKDDTVKTLIEKFDLRISERFYENQLKHKKVKAIYNSPIYPNLIVVDKENGGRSDALNAGIDIARNPVFCTLDADSILDPSALLETIQPFIENPDKMVATGGTVRIVNGCQVENGTIIKVQLSNKILVLLQIVEYIRAFLMGRLAYSRLGIVTIISGAFAVFKRDIAVAAGGFTHNTMGEDLELVIKIHKYCCRHKIKYQMRFVPEPVCWTEAPESMEVLKKQRIRWQQGGLEVFFRHRDMLFNPKYGRIGMLAYPLMLVFDVIGPLAELLSYILFPIFYMLGALNLKFMIAFLAMFFVFGIFISVMSLVLEEMSLKRFNSVKELIILGFTAIIENFGYRQYNNIWRIIGWWRFIRKKQHWGDMKRIGRK